MRPAVDARPRPIGDVKASRLNLCSTAVIAAEQRAPGRRDQHVNALADINGLPERVPGGFPLLAPPNRRHGLPSSRRRIARDDVVLSTATKSGPRVHQRSPYPVSLSSVKSHRALDVAPSGA